MQLSDSDLVIASRAIFTLVVVRHNLGLHTKLIFDHRSIVTQLYDYCMLEYEHEEHDSQGDYMEYSVDPLSLEIFQDHDHISQACFRMLGLKQHQYHHGYFPSLSKPLSLLFESRKCRSYRDYGTYAMMFPPPKGEEFEKERVRRFWRSSVVKLTYDAKIPVVIPGSGPINTALDLGLMNIHESTYPFYFPVETLEEFLFLLLNAKMVIGWQSPWTHLAAAFHTPLLCVCKGDKDNQERYNYSRGTFPLEYLRIRTDQDWNAKDVFQKVLNLESQFLPLC